MEKFSQFGVEPILLLAQVVNFLLLLYLLKRFLYKPILELLKRREEKIREGFAAADRGEELLVKAKEEERTIVSKANDEANMLIEVTKNRVSQIEEQMLSQAKQESQELIARAKKQIEEEEEAAMRRLENRVATIAIGMVERILPKTLSREDHIRIIKAGTKMLEETLPT